MTSRRCARSAPTSAAEAAILFKPTTAWRVRWNTSTDMPWPKEEPTAQNPPDGAFINYYLKCAPPTDRSTLEILQADGKLVRRYSSADPVTAIPEAAAAPVPLYWYRKPQALSTAAGMHRFMWDVHYQPLGGGGGGGRGGGGALPIQAIPGNSAAPPSTPWANPGTYTVKLTVNGKSYTQPITVKQDPRVKTPALVMQSIYADTKAAYYGAIDAQEAARQAQSLARSDRRDHTEADGRRRRRDRRVRQEGRGCHRFGRRRRRRWTRRRSAVAAVAAELLRGGGRGAAACSRQRRPLRLRLRLAAADRGERRAVRRDEFVPGRRRAADRESTGGDGRGEEDGGRGDGEVERDQDHRFAGASI